MRFFKNDEDKALDAQREAVAAETVAALEAGRIPPSAERRLTALRAGGEAFFTSDLSVDEFARVRQLGLRPVTQVMGSCVYHVNWRWRRGVFNTGGTGAEDLPELSHAWNDARSRALSRLEQEAAYAGASAVVGVKITKGAYDWARNAIEFMAIGTAVRVDGEIPTERPVLTALTAQDYFKLREAGCAPVGVVGGSRMALLRNVTQATGKGWFRGSFTNQEIPQYTQALYGVREGALGVLNQQAAALGAHGVVGVSIDQHEDRYEYEVNETEHVDLVVNLHVLGTAIVEHEHRPITPTTSIDLRAR